MLLGKSERLFTHDVILELKLEKGVGIHQEDGA